MRIFLIRHGETPGNLDHTQYAEYYDPLLPLTEFGWEQAQAAGVALKKYYESRDDLAPLSKIQPHIFHSPMPRARTTKDGVLQAFSEDEIGPVRESTLLRERDFGAFGTLRDEEEMKEKFGPEWELFEFGKERSKFYAKPPEGLSFAEVTDRMHTFIARQIDWCERHGVEDFVIVAHDVAIRSFLAAWMEGQGEHTPEWVNESKSIPNGSITMIEGDVVNKFKVETIFEGKKRLPNLSKDYKIAPYDGKNGEYKPAQSTPAR